MNYEKISNNCYAVNGVKFVKAGKGLYFAINGDKCKQITASDYNGVYNAYLDALAKFIGVTM